MDSKIYRVDPRMITPVALAMGFGAVLLVLEGPTPRGLLLLLLLWSRAAGAGRTHPERVAAAFAAFAVLLSGCRDPS